MSLIISTLGPGDRVFHPKYGFGTIHSLMRRDRLHPIQEPSMADIQSDRTEDYYDIALLEGGTLLVPVGRAQTVGLRRLTNGLAFVTEHLCSPPEGLPDNLRQRSALLREREQMPAPEALAHSVRDLLGRSRGRSLSESEKTWLDRSCQRMSTEVSLVDGVTIAEARAGVLAVVGRLCGMQL
jgi:RNA polymerase-interacting CarD/CdnL/TRCF family regulator